MKQELRSGQRVRVKQKGTWKFGGLTMTNNVFENVTVVRCNANGSYQVRGIIKTPDSDEIEVPGDWIEAL